MKLVKKKILFVFGTRPEAIKLAPLILKLKKYSHLFESKVIITSQHQTMLKQVLELFKITPDYDLNIMQENQTLDYITTTSLTKLTPILEKEAPDLVIVHGDTTTTLSASLASFYKRIPVAHVEAGLRTHNKYNPYPEEINRALTDKIALFHFAPTKKAVENLKKENIKSKHIYLTGNTIVDALYLILNKKTKINFPFNINHKKVIYVTAHRRENFGKPLENICLALKKIVKNNPQFKIIYPVHYNPNVENTVYKLLGNHPQIHLISPVDYQTAVNLMEKSYLVLTDSGGIQEEVASLNKPTLVLRAETERPEILESGKAILVGTDQEKIFTTTQKLIADKKTYLKMTKKKNPFGDGRASERIVKILISQLFKVDDQYSAKSVLNTQ